MWELMCQGQEVVKVCKSQAWRNAETTTKCHVWTDDEVESLWKIKLDCKTTSRVDNENPQPLTGIFKNSSLKCLKIALILGEQPNHIQNAIFVKFFPCTWTVEVFEISAILTEGCYSCLSQQHSHFLQQFPQWLEGVPTLLSPSVRFEHSQLQMAFITLPKCDYGG